MKTRAVLEGIADLLRAYVEVGERALADLDIGDSDAIDRYIVAAEASVAQLPALQMELDAYWPPDETGARGRDGLPDSVLSLSDLVFALADRAARLEAAQAETLGRRMDRASSALVLARLSRRTEGRYRPAGQESDARLLDLRS